MAVVAGVGRLTPPVDVDGPRVRLGLLWAAVTFVAVAAGPLTTSLVFAVVALGAAGQACRTWRRSGHRPFVPVAAGGAALAALAGCVSPLAVVAAVVLIAVTGLAAAQLRPGGTAWDVRVTLAIGISIGVAAASPAIVRNGLGALPALVLVALVHAVDASAFIVGSGARSRWEGPVAGLASAGAVGLAVAATMAPPFRGASPWILAGVIAVAVPAGGVMATALLGRDEAPVPALRRLDAYLLAGPAWALLATILLDA